MIKFLILNTFLISIHSQLIFQDFCVDRNATSQSVIDYCASYGGLLKSRCCYSLNSIDIIAIDLTELDLVKIPNLNEYKNLINVSLIDLRLNIHLKQFENEDFLGMKSLKTLYLPDQYSCPGGKSIWQMINKTIDPSGFVCMNQKDFCENSTNLCPESNSYCTLNGPNHFLCLCKQDYYGYKCLRHGQFPFGTFLGISLTLTVVFSVFFYLTQRRNVKND
ncbi:hypothetical protein I4U23_027794 [Adineta vaga]|nr:hypothetical protein I4U23_027794 [Adineta vaga]